MMNSDDILAPRFARLIIYGSLVFLLLFGSVNVYFGRPHVDEGFYFITPWLVSRGQLPYGDFIYTQTPLHAMVYSLPYRLGVGPDYAATRFLSLFFGFLAIVVATLLAGKRAGPSAAMICSLLLCFNAFLIYQFSQAKLYPLASFFVTIGISLVVLGEKSVFRTAIGGLFLAAATGVRVSMVPALAVYFLYICIRFRHDITRMVLLIFLPLAGLTAMIAPFYLRYSEQFIYSVFTYNYAKDVQPLWMSIMLRLDVLSKISHEFFLLAALILFLVMWYPLQLSKRTSDGVGDLFRNLSAVPLERMYLIVSVLAVGGLQAVSKSGVVDEYLTPIIPLTASLVAIELIVLYRSQGGNLSRYRQHLVIGLLMLSALQFLAWGRTSLTLMHGKSPVRYYNDVASYLAAITRPGDMVLSYNNAMVVLAGRTIVPGYEMHTATHDPRWNTERCRRFRILHMDDLEDMLEQQRIAAVLMGKNSFIGRFPDFYNPGEEQMRDRLTVLLENNYQHTATYPELGYFQTDIECWLRHSRIDQQ